LRVGILGGAFNPPHIGHLVCAQEALIQLELDTLVWVPVGEAPHRELQEDPGPEGRLEMVELAIADDERFTASRIEIDREGPSYTLDTLDELHKQSSKDELFLILGGDQAAALATWHEPEKVLERATLAVFERMSWGRRVRSVCATSTCR
jgi:nicotinate-nucleotide adenylyltransferase